MKIRYVCCAILMLLVLNGCRTKKVTYDRVKIIKKFKDYRVYLNNEKLINLDTFYLDKDNIDRVIANNQSNTLNIFQKDKNTVFTSLSEIVLSLQKEMNAPDSLTTVINGILIEGMKQKSIKIEAKAVKEINSLKKEKVWDHLSHLKYGLVLVVTN